LNSIKHAFPAGKFGEICILGIHHSCQDDKFTLIVRDNGIGLPDFFDFRNTESLGLQLVCVLTKQLKGTVELYTGMGVEFKITFFL
jgi:two-component sensor histidine kinase